MNPVVLSVATGGYVRGQNRLRDAVLGQADFMSWTDTMPPGSPSHLDIPFAFKAHAVEQARLAGYNVILWADACILPIAPLGPLFEKIERDGAWVMNNGFANAEWTVPEAYQYLGVTPDENEHIPHVVAGVFGVNLQSEIGCAVFDEYLRLAKTRAFCGPVRLLTGTRGSRGDMRISGHRHDQVGLSVAAWKAGVELTNPPEHFCYRGGETAATTLVADSNY